MVYSLLVSMFPFPRVEPSMASVTSGQLEPANSPSREMAFAGLVQHTAVIIRIRIVIKLLLYLTYKLSFLMSVHYRKIPSPCRVRDYPWFPAPTGGLGTYHPHG